MVHMDLPEAIKENVGLEKDTVSQTNNFGRHLKPISVASRARSATSVNVSTIMRHLCYTVQDSNVIRRVD